MDNLEKYNKIFIETFGISREQLNGLKYQDIKEWDSIGHMSLVAGLEDEFEIMLDADDIIEMSSYEIGKEILAKYNIIF
ncbi:hypothetical protein [Syntrophomonas palmitatica]|uniref:hypothetical protein n=1 Tax=Syntrophomonas palmitatica TaxID=402877 RepID=UPI0006CFC2DE|nr:hypothetical protein [Syntrophomonas palmitatica]